MKSIKKTTIIFMTIILILFMIQNGVYASLVNGFKNEISGEGAGPFILKDQGGKIVGIIQVIGTIVSVGMLMVLGIKYMIGSAEQKAEYKKSMFPYLIGAILIFGFSNITQVIFDIAINI